MRIYSPAALALFGKRMALAQLVEMDLTVPVYITTARETLVANSKTYIGGKQTQIKVTNQGGAIQGLSFTLSGVNPDNLAIALAEPIQGKAVRCYLCIMNPDTLAVVHVQQDWAGTLDQMPITQGGGTATVTVTADHRGISFARPKGFRYTDADQQLLYPNDLSLQFVVAQAVHQDVWPAAAFFRQ